MARLPASSSPSSMAMSKCSGQSWTGVGESDRVGIRQQLLEHARREGEPSGQGGSGVGVDAVDRLAPDVAVLARDELRAVDVQLGHVPERGRTEAAGQRAQPETAGDPLARGLEHLLGDAVQPGAGLGRIRAEAERARLQMMTTRNRWPYRQNPASRPCSIPAQAQRTRRLQGVQERPVTGDSAVRLVGARKEYGNVVAVDGIDLDIRGRRVLHDAGPVGLRQDHLPEVDRRLRAPRRRAHRAGRARRERPAALRARRQHRLPGLRAVPAHVRWPERRVRAEDQEGRRRRAPPARLRGARAWCAGRLRGPPARASSRAASASALRSPGRWSTGPRVLLLDEPLGALDLKLRQQMQHELRTLQQEVGITFVYVTHDQEEALTMSDRLAVFNDGRIEQIGAPADVYEHPANEFVAGFVGRLQHRGARRRALHDPPREGAHPRRRRGLRTVCASRRGRSATSPTSARSRASSSTWTEAASSRWSGRTSRCPPRRRSSSGAGGCASAGEASTRTRSRTRRNNQRRDSEDATMAVVVAARVADARVGRADGGGLRQRRRRQRAAAAATTRPRPSSARARARWT